MTQASRSIAMFAAVIAASGSMQAMAWGSDGHSIIAELGQRRLTPAARQEVERLLGPGVSLASVSNWGGDYCAPPPENFNLLDVDIRAGKCPKCAPRLTHENLHAIWDSTLIGNVVWNWGAYVTRIEEGWLATAESRGADAGTVEEWTLASHRVGADIWTWTPE